MKTAPGLLQEPPTIRPKPRRALAALLSLMLANCSANYPAAHLPEAALAAQPAEPVFVMQDGARLPYREWLPATAPQIVVLALHGFNDSADAWELPAPAMAASGIAVIAPDQRGFGAAPDRGRWPGTQTLTTMAAETHARFPNAKLYLMGESMGAAILLCLAASPNPPPVSAYISGYVLVAPAVWGRSQMNLLLRASLFLTNSVAPGLLLSAGPIRVKASDNRAALIRLSTDPRTLIRTRVAAVKGLVDLMSDALAATARLTPPTPILIQYGGHDELVPKRAMAAAWRTLAPHPEVRLAYYPEGYHLLLRDLHRQAPTEDLIAWLANPAAPLPSRAESAAQSWLTTLPPHAKQR
jgi:alpha-beta hydrolase superfamily lysophospholipase